MTHDIVSGIGGAWRESHLLVCCALDGVLAEPGEHPGDAKVPSSRRALLASLASLPDASVLVFSGRRLAQVQAATGRDRRVYYVGLRGLEVEGPRLSFFHLGAARTADSLSPLAAMLHGLAREIPGLVVEYRNLYLAVRLGWVTPQSHRDAAAQRVRDLIAPFASTHRLRIQSSGTDIEVLPDVKWTSSDAIREVRLAVERQHGACTPLVIASGIGRDDAFDAVSEEGIGVAIGGNAPATHRLAHRDEAEALLLDLVRMGHHREGQFRDEQPELRVAL